MAAYAALNSLMYSLQQIQHHPRPPITLEKQHMDSLCEIIRLLQDFLENYSHRDIGDDKEALESQIANAAYAAEDVIETHIVDQILAKSNFQEYNFINLFGRAVKEIIPILACSSCHKTDHQIRTGDGEMISSNSLFCQDLQKVIEDMYLIKKEIIEIEEKIVGINDDQSPRQIISMCTDIIGSSTVPDPTRKNTDTMVGLDHVLLQIMDRLTGHPPNRQVLPIVGMGGIGKTTLARHAYNKPLIVHHFHIRIWITISQEYRLRDILLEALSFLDQRSQKDENKREHELEELLYKSLCGKRYLVILDDMWRIESWEKLMLFLPDNNNGSRIIITTRLSEVSNYFGSCGIKMNFLDEDKSWDLFCKIVFPPHQCCPSELEEIGKKIARNCKGLPLSIAVIGGLLANSEKTRKHWEYIAGNVNLTVNLEDDMQCLKVLYLSYNHLPIHLKPCFLYMGVFPEDSVIPVSSLKKLWVAEGFLKPIAAKSLEVVAEECLNDLIDRNLILVHKLGCSGKVKYCKIHDLLRDLCLREGKKSKFLWVSELRYFDLEGIQCLRRISVYKEASNEYHIDRVLNVVSSASLARSLILDKSVRMLSHSLRLVRVFSAGSKYQYLEKENRYSLKDVFKFVNSRYLDFNSELESNSIIPSSIQLPWNLQTLIIRGPFMNVDVSPKFWKMSQLRHVDFQSINIQLLHPPDIPLIHKGDDELILKNLHTLKGMRNLRLSKNVIKRIPNIKKLQVSYSDSDKRWWHKYYLNNLGLLNKLESLNICWYCKRSFRIELVKNLTFPHSLKKLTLSKTDLRWEDMRVIGSLPHLQELKLELKLKSFCGTEWNPFEGEFLCLKFLLIANCSDLVNWNANRSHFPCLEQLLLRSLPSLGKIPLDIGHIPTLRSIDLYDCSNSAVMSAKDLFDEQVGLGNEDLQVDVTCLDYSELERLTTHNFRVQNLLVVILEAYCQSVSHY